ncbi:hypothetical protein ACNRBV_04125 [Ralstonia pseudosolanacearum]|uniref:Uncharacterized protein n=1 Tax=Ralstonia solanacearum TaxID=305 RepID=A0ABY6NK33_RALSL|nr:MULTISPECIES: hypothetical protein [Ralstonia]UZF17386.1 hypothetical protein LH706_25910 [Ralstonia solanacearum]MCK4140583.1 hypothetical protein [Ralstonia pseudosolanacearum]UQY85134.1 hypothetical protein JNO62_18055 [Ralstonia pseudosolanacearum]UZF27089.1 hypothetical protein LGV80_23560 [Ralstonia sp. RS642]UZF32141.1 hypothetical protein LGV82_23970 [Ralstonia sp. RS650]
MVKRKPKGVMVARRALFWGDLWTRARAVERGDVQRVTESECWLRASLHALGGLMGVW